MSKSKKKRIIIIIVILTAFCLYFVVGNIRYNLDYNHQLQETKERYQILHDDLEALINGDVPEFQNIDYEFAFFLREYIEWEKMYIERDEVNRLPDEIYGLVSFPDDAPAREFRQIRDIYYDCIEQVYFDKGKPDEDMAERLAIADEEFNALFVEVDLL